MPIIPYYSVRAYVNKAKYDLNKYVLVDTFIKSKRSAIKLAKDILCEGDYSITSVFQHPKCACVHTYRVKITIEEI